MSQARLGGVKHLHGEAQGAVDAPIEECLGLLADLEAYPSWYPEVVNEVEVVEYGDDGLPLKAATKLHLSYGPASRDLELLLAVRVHRPGLVQLTHVRSGSSSGASFDATWRLEDHGGTHLKLELDAVMPVPRLVPLRRVGNTYATGFMQAAARRLESGS